MLGKIGFIGRGNMGRALIIALTSSGRVRPSDILTSGRSPDKADDISGELGVGSSGSNAELAAKSDVIVLAVKPQDMGQVLDEIREAASGKLVVSIAAGVRIKSIEKTLDARVVRVMPNTPCVVGEMAAAYTLGSKAYSRDGRKVREMLECAGMAFEVKEELLDVVTALGGSGPAFIAKVIEGLAEGAASEGMEMETALKLAKQTCMGTGKLLLDAGMSTDVLVKMVSSPGGTTEEGLKVMDGSGVKKILADMVRASARKSRELAGRA